MAKIEIMAELCKNCGLCKAVCPKDVIGVGDYVNKKGFTPVIMENEEACIGCAMCATMCPEAAIEVWK